VVYHPFANPFLPPSFYYNEIQLTQPHTLINALTDKIEDAKARSAIRAQVEADKRARAERAAREKALREGTLDLAVPAESSSADSTAAVSSSAVGSSSSGVAGRDFKDTRLQIRMASGGQPYTTTLPSDSSLCFSLLSFRDKNLSNWD